METNNTPEKNNPAQSADHQHTPATNDEILSLLRQLVLQNAAAKEQTASAQSASTPEPAPDATSEIKHLLEEVLKQKTAPANVAMEEDDTDSEDDDDFNDDFFWNPGPEWETIGYVAGGAALVGLGALLYHWLKD